MAREGGRRQGGRRGHAEAVGDTTNHDPYIKRHIPYFEAWSQQEIAQIMDRGEEILETVGVNVLNTPAALELFKNAGATIDGERVKIPRKLAHELISTVPSQFTQHARNPAKNVEIGGNNAVLGPIYGAPFVKRGDEERRYANINDFRDIVKLVYMLPGIHHSGGTVCEPVDIPVNKRHLDMIYTHLRYSDKPFMGSVTAGERAQDTVDMAKIVFGDEFVDKNCVIVSLINANSPLSWDETMLDAMMTYAKHNQASIISPFILMGAMSPVTVPAALAQAYAENLVGLALTQLVRKGAPALFGVLLSSMSMQNGAPTFGTAEDFLAVNGAVMIGRKLGLPVRTATGLTGSKLPDAQAGYETTSTLWASGLAGAHFMMHTAGWMEGGLVACLEKLVMDAEMDYILGRILRGAQVDDNGLAKDVYNEAGPGSHFLGTTHTQDNFRTAYYASKSADYDAFETWQDNGALDAGQRAKVRCQKLLDSYVMPELDEAIDKALLAFIEKRKDSMEDSWIS